MDKVFEKFINDVSSKGISMTPLKRNVTLRSHERQYETISACTCSASCGSNYSRNGGCTCSTSCGSNYSR